MRADLPFNRRGLLLGAALLPWLRSVQAQPALPAPQALEIEAGVFMLPGTPGEPAPANGGRLGNAGFIVGRLGVLAVDSGTSFAHGRALLAAIAEVTPLSVKAVLLTQARQEFVFGATAFQAQGVAVHMHRAAAGLMASRCENCLKTLRTELGDEAMGGTAVPKADVLFDETHVLDTIGRPVLIQHHGLADRPANGPGSSSALDVRTGTLMAGGLIDNHRIPDVQDGDIDTWRAALGALRSLRIETIVPAHGATGGRELVARQDRYLALLQARCAALLKSNTALSAVPDEADLPDYRNWDQYDIIHRRNASVVFLRLERQQLLAPAEPEGGRT